MSMAPILPTDRIHLSPRPKLVPFTLSESELMEGHMGKPNGLWYGLGTEWIEWVQENPGIKEYDFAYRLSVNMERVLVVDTPEKLKQLVKSYALPRTQTDYLPIPDPHGWDISIDWIKVARHYDGIEFPAIFGYYAHWYRGMNVPGGCIWKAEVITHVETIPYPINIQS